MARTYHLLCFDCRCYLSLGKVFWATGDGSEPIDITFQGVYDAQSKTWRKQDVFFGRVMEAYLIQHRNHELRLVPEGVDELLDTELSMVSPVDALELLRAQGTIRADAPAELQDWAARLGGGNPHPAVPQAKPGGGEDE
jgi:hypothetical protein